jgi:CBS domain-containing protein
MFNESRRLAGIVYLSEVRHILKERTGSMIIGELVESNPVEASPNELPDDGVRCMVKGNLTTIPVADNGTGEPVGSTTNSDVITSITGQNGSGAK